MTLAGMCLRVAAARGDLWLDEIWSYRLLEGLPSIRSIFFDLPYDNNHPLNTAWLAVVGPDASPVLARLPAIVFGTLCIPVAARIGGRRHYLAGLFAAVLVASDGILVHFASEARGYSGLILAVLVAFDSLEVILGEGRTRMAFVALAGAIAIGSLSQLTMIAASAVLGATAAVRVLMRHGWTWGAGRTIAAIAAAIAAGTMPAFVCFAISISGGIIHTGIATPFSWASYAAGIAQTWTATFGWVPHGVDPGLTCAMAALICAIGIAAVPKEARVFPLLAIFGISAVQAALRLPNENGARFHLVSSLGVIILAIELAGRIAKGGPGLRRLGGLLAAAAIMGQAVTLIPLLEVGRGSYGSAVRAMAAEGPIAFQVQPRARAGETGAVVRWYAAKTGVAVIEEGSGCPVTPWLIIVRTPDEAGTAPAPIDPACPARYAPRATFPAYGLSGFTWSLLHREAGSAAP